MRGATGSIGCSRYATLVADNIRFIAEPLPGLDEPVGQPGGAEDLGPVGVDTELVQDIPRRDAG
ncbi:hypothetical protein ACQPZQ_35430 [Pseudonocardia sp. CA-142604]|uniref:hypothetical protein n=1 Tax=Pseudonocardia sp. CA-142604 TaxID=3240024 RepID=UPI003D92051C